MARKKFPTLSEFVRQVRAVKYVRPLVDGIGIVSRKQLTISLKDINSLPPPFGPNVVAEQQRARPQSRSTRSFRLWPQFDSNHNVWQFRAQSILLQYDLDNERELSPAELDALRDALELWGLWK